MHDSNSGYRVNDVAIIVRRQRQISIAVRYLRTISTLCEQEGNPYLVFFSYPQGGIFLQKKDQWYFGTDSVLDQRTIPLSYSFEVV